MLYYNEVVDKMNLGEMQISNMFRALENQNHIIDGSRNRTRVGFY